MPEMTFTLQWPDGRLEDCYSPSLVVHDHLSTGGVYTVADLTGRCAEAMRTASERVRARYGFACTSAAATLEQVRASAGRHAPDAQVVVVAMRPELEEAL